MKSYSKYLFVVLLVVFFNANAQEVTKKDTLAGTPISISMDKKIDALLGDMEDNCDRAVATNTSSRDNGSSTSVGSSTSSSKPNTSTRALTTEEICRQNPRILGAKIQLVVVKSNAEANEVKAYFRRRFPHIKTEVDASLRPNYKVLAGSYFSKDNAKGDLAKIRQYFKSAIVIPYRVFCVEAK